MNKKLVLFFIAGILILNDTAKADDFVDIPCVKIKTDFRKTIITDEYDTVSGLDFTGHGKPRFYDPMYYNYYINDPRYKLYYNYPVQCVPNYRKRK